MTTKKTMQSFGPWIRTRNVIVSILAQAWDHANAQEFSEDENSEFVKANLVVDDLLELLKDHAVIGLKAFDEEIADSGLIERLAKLSKEAKAEADRIKEAVERVDDFAAALAKVTEVVGELTGLPFV